MLLSIEVNLRSYRSCVKGDDGREPSTSVRHVRTKQTHGDRAVTRASSKNQRGYHDSVPTQEIKPVCMTPALSFTTLCLSRLCLVFFVSATRSRTTYRQPEISVSEVSTVSGERKATCELNQAASKNSGATLNEIFKRIYCATRPRSVGETQIVSDHGRPFVITGDFNSLGASLFTSAFAEHQKRGK